MKLFIVGDSGAGKTSFCRWLQKLQFEEQHFSTELAELTIITLRNWISDPKTRMAKADRKMEKAEKKELKGEAKELKAVAKAKTKKAAGVD